MKNEPILYEQLEKVNNYIYKNCVCDGKSPLDGHCDTGNFEGLTELDLAKIIDILIKDDTQLNKYVVHEVRGGLMEDPNFHYHNPEEIIAESEDEARRIYDRRNGLYYFTGNIKSKLGKTTEPKTSNEPLSAERNEHRIEFYGEDII